MALMGFSHRLLSSSFLGLPYRLLNLIHKKELLRGLWVALSGVSGGGGGAGLQVVALVCSTVQQFGCEVRSVPKRACVCIYIYIHTHIYCFNKQINK